VKTREHGCESCLRHTKRSPASKAEFSGRQVRFYFKGKRTWRIALELTAD
jgi:hypothetical protein